MKRQRAHARAAAPAVRTCGSRAPARKDIAANRARGHSPPRRMPHAGKGLPSQKLCFAGSIDHPRPDGNARGRAAARGREPSAASGGGLGWPSCACGGCTMQRGRGLNRSCRACILSRVPPRLAVELRFCVHLRRPLTQALTSCPARTTKQLHLWGSSSAGRASPSQGGGRGFKSLLLHQEFFGSAKGFGLLAELAFKGPFFVAHRDFQAQFAVREASTCCVNSWMICRLKTISCNAMPIL